MFVIATINGKFMSEVYTHNGLDFETEYESDAKKFDSKEDAEKFIDESGIDKKFAFVTEAESE